MTQFLRNKEQNHLVGIFEEELKQITEEEEEEEEDDEKKGLEDNFPVDNFYLEVIDLLFCYSNL